MSLAAHTAADSTATTAATADLTVDQLVRTNLPLVGHLVREVAARVPAHVHRDDLVSAGMYALTVSAQSYDSSQGVPFARFASIRIRGALTDELRSMDWASRSVRSRAREISTVRAELAQQLGHSPSRTELSEATGMSGNELDAVDNDVARATVTSLQTLTATGADDILPTGVDGPENLVLRRERIGYLHDAIAELPERLRVVVAGYFFEQRKMADIAEELGVTESRVSQMRSEALAVLRLGMNSMTDDVPAPAPTGRGKQATAQAYCAAVAARSTLAGRLSATTVLGESHAELIAAAG